jgi:hypothetical protein
MGSITAANAIFLIQIPGLIPVPVQLQGFSADDIFDFDPQAVVETSMGVDGILSGGFVNVAVKQSITLQADSASNDIFDLWQQAQRTALDVLTANGIVTLTSIGKQYALTTGFLTDYPPVRGAGRILKPQKYGVTWQSVTPAPV